MSYAHGCFCFKILRLSLLEETLSIGSMKMKSSRVKLKKVNPTDSSGEGHEGVGRYETPGVESAIIIFSDPK